MVTISHSDEGIMLGGFICPRDKTQRTFNYCLGVCGKCVELPFYYAITRDLRDLQPSSFSVTEILKSYLQVHLQRKHTYFIEPEDLAFMAFGTAFHMLIASGQVALHEAGFEEYLFEKTLHFEKVVSTNHGVATLHGTPDQYNYSTNILVDYKTLKYFYDGRALREGQILTQSSLIKHYYQTNIYRRYKFPDCKSIKLFTLYKDYNNRLKKEGIPPYELHDVPLMPDEEVDRLVSIRLDGHMAVQGGMEPPDCSPDERFYQPDSNLSLACIFYCSVRSVCPIRTKFVKLGADGQVIMPEEKYRMTKAPKARTKGRRNASSVRNSGPGLS